MKHPADLIIEEAQAKLPAYQQNPRHIADVGYKGDVAIFKLPYADVVEVAMRLLRQRVAESRADAAELAFDAIFQARVEGGWDRTGEVHLDKEREVARAFCSSMDKEVLSV